MFAFFLLPLLLNAKSPNFIFFIPDELRSDALGCYGNELSQTPNFDAFAAEGTRFAEAHVSFTVCSQSRVSFATGWPSHVNGHRTLSHLLHDWEPNLLKYLKQSGYEVMWWGKNDLLANDSWVSSVDSALTYGNGAVGRGNIAGTNHSDPRWFSMVREPYTGDITQSGEYKNVQAAIDYLKTHAASGSDKPFALYMPLWDPHPPYSSPEEYYNLIDRSKIPDLRPANLDGKPDYHKWIRYYRNLSGLNDTFWKELHGVYLGSVAWSDYLFGRLIEAVKDAGYWDDTVITVFSDHGDYAGDYGLMEKWPSGLEDILTHVPMMVRVPGFPAGQVIDTMTQVFDVVPTVLELANITATHIHFAESMVPMLNGSSQGDPDRAAFAEGGYSTLEPRDLEGYIEGSDGCDPTTGPHAGPWSDYCPKMKQQLEQPLSVCRSFMIKTATSKLVFRTDPQDLDHYSEFYDLTTDPKELTNLYNDDSYAGEIAALKDRLLKWLAITSDVTPWNVDDRSGQPGVINGTTVFYSGVRPIDAMMDSYSGWEPTVWR